MFSYGGWAFLQNFSVQLIGYTDVVVIALLLGMERVAVYSVALMLALHGGNIVAHVFRVIVPNIGQAAGREDFVTLRWYIIKSARVTTLIATPLLIGFMTLGGDFIRLWMGPGFEASRWVLLILAAAYWVGLLCWAPTLALKSLGYVRTTATISLCEAVMNLVLSVTFVVSLGWGIYGVAGGTVVPAILVNAIATLSFMQRRIGLMAGTLLRQLFVPGLMAGMCFAGLCLLLRYIMPLKTWSAFAVGVAGLSMTWIPIGYRLLLPHSERRVVQGYVVRWTNRVLGRAASG